MIKVFNTLTRKKEELVPLRPGEIRMYVCGVTVYDLSHIGHGRSALAFDVIRRYLRYRGYEVRFIRNFTDVDDKIIKRAHEEGVPPGELAERYIEEYRKDMAALAILPADVEPKATDHIPQMIKLIERLVAKGVAYPLDGDVYFEVKRFPRYGRLSGKNLDELQAGARVEVDERKRDPLDFALWKASKEGEPAWPSPWGPGRPGWHIECSAMSMQYLGESFDIHAGGEDLVFPHHENEIAQSEAATGRPFVRYWIHNGFVNLGAEKMSKSLGNVLTLKELLRHHEPEALRLYLLGTHYRNPLDFSNERVAEAARALERFRNLFEEADRLAAKGTPAPGRDQGLLEEVAEARRRFEEVMDDDFNTAQAVAVLFDLAHRLQSFKSKVTQREAAAGAFLLGVGELMSLGRVLGLFEEPSRPSQAVDPELRGKIEALVNARAEARQRRDWAGADRLRDELARLGVTVEDGPEGTTWKWKP
ncbi:MAG: cysteinyl-tRNA synthetase, cysteinyl-tRNA synthetase [Candidatus Rokubacteria bacterium CSP1-6]|nr:MAG: cysteinyl-tRNA synthetase, cysteinyl-tRNA synthetase [Candidatus Rokubacteria bacterium CSP1-6]